MWNESYGVFFRESHEENKVLTIDRKVMTGIGSFQVLKCLGFFFHIYVLFWLHIHTIPSFIWQMTDNPRNGAKAEKQGDYISILCSL